MKIESHQLRKDAEARIVLLQEGGASDEEDVRELWTLTIQNAAAKALDELQNIEMEEKVLEMMCVVPPAEAEARRQKELAASQEHRGITVTHLMPGGRSRREQIRAGVFRPFHNQPTMSLEELAEREVVEAMERSERSARCGRKQGKDDGGDPGRGA